MTNSCLCLTWVVSNTHTVGSIIARAVLDTCSALLQTHTHTDGVGSTPSVGHQIALLTLKNSLVKTHKHSANLYFRPVDQAFVSFNRQSRYINTLTNYKIVTTSADLPLRQRIWQVVVQISNYYRSQCTIRALGWLITIIMTSWERSAGYCFLTGFMKSLCTFYSNRRICFLSIF